MVRAMTCRERYQPRAPRRGQAVWRAEMAETVKLALPMALTQLGQIAMMTSDLALIGRLGDEAVAAAALAHTVLFIGVRARHGHRLGGRAARRASTIGARQPRMVRRALRVGLWAAVILGVPLTLVQLWGGELLIALGQTPETPRSPAAICPASPGACAGLVLHRAAQFHGRGQPAGARRCGSRSSRSRRTRCSPMR